MAEPPVVAEEDEVLLGRGEEVHVGPPVLAVRVEQVVPAGKETSERRRCGVRRHRHMEAGGGQEWRKGGGWCCGTGNKLTYHNGMNNA